MNIFRWVIWSYSENEFICRVGIWWDLNSSFWWVQFFLKLVLFWISKFEIELFLKKLFRVIQTHILPECGNLEFGIYLFDSRIIVSDEIDVQLRFDVSNFVQRAGEFETFPRRNNRFVPKGFFSEIIISDNDLSISWPFTSFTKKPSSSAKMWY